MMSSIVPGRWSNNPIVYHNNPIVVANVKSKNNTADSGDGTLRCERRRNRLWSHGTTSSEIIIHSATITEISAQIHEVTHHWCVNYRPANQRQCWDTMVISYWLMPSYIYNLITKLLFVTPALNMVFFIAFAEVKYGEKFNYFAAVLNL